jgi:hypothetical protein
MLFEVVEELPFGKLVRAKVDILPGTLLFRETPILRFPVTDSLKYAAPGDTEDLQKAKAAYFNFLELPAEKKLKFLGLYSQSGDRTKHFKKHLEDCAFFKVEDISLVVKVVSICYFNQFRACGDFVIYDTCSRFSHSCYPN